MEEVTQLLTVKIDKTAVDEAIKKAAAARKELDELRKSNKELAKAEGDNTVAITENNIKIKEQSKIIQQNEKIVIANNKAKESTLGYIKQQRNALSVLTEKWANLSEAQLKDEKIGGELVKDIKRRSDELKKLEGATGNNTRSVGGYTDAIREALGQTTLFSGVTKGLATAQKAVATATDIAKTSTQSFGAAFKAIGIGLIVSLVASLVSYFSRFQKGINLVEQAFAGVSTFVNVFLDALGTLGESIVGQIMPILGGLYDVVSGLVTFKFDKVSKGFDAISESVSKIDTVNLGEVAKQAVEAAEAAVILEEKMQDLLVKENDLNVERKKSRVEINKLRQAGEDETKTLQERFEAQQKAIQLEQEGIDQSLKLGREKLEILKAQNILTISDEEAKQKVRDQEVVLADLELESTNKQLELSAKLRALRAQVAAEDKAQKEKAAQEEKERIDASFKQLQKSLEDQEALENEFFESERKKQVEAEIINTEIINTEINDRKEQFIKGLITKEEYEAALNRIESEALAIRKFNAELAIEDANNSLTLSEAERLRIITESQAEIEAVRGESLTRQLAASDAATQKEMQNEATLANFKKQTRADVLNFVIEVFGKESLAGKLAASFQAGLNTAEGITNALKLTFPLNLINAALVGAQGAIQIAKINSTSVPDVAGFRADATTSTAPQPKRTRRFATGIIGIDGQGTATSDSIDAKISRGESVLTAAATSAFSPLLAQMELAVGNKPNFGSSTKRFANGFIPTNVLGSSSISSDIKALRGDINRLADRPSVVRVSEIIEVSNRVSNVKVSSELA
jgi:hypothetical protein